MNAEDARLPKQNIQSPERRAKDIAPGEQNVLSQSAEYVGANLRAWSRSDATLMDAGVLSDLSIQVKRTADGFIL